jgi:Na+:H+ antiporter, NhaA family
LAESVENRLCFFVVRKAQNMTLKNLKNNPAFPGIVLVAVALLAIVWANSPLSGAYDAMKSVRLAIPFLALDKPLELWVNDLLMAMFFLLVGLELKKEIIKGELSNPRRASLAIFAALGGMLAPAAIYAVLNAGSSGAPGWGIPMATDIAFAVGVLSLLGTRVPLPLKIFLTALAVVDDMGAVLVIAVFYTSKINLLMLGLAGLLLAVLWGLNAARVKALPVYLGLGLVLWYLVLKSGLHATIAGVLLASTIPLGKGDHNPLETLEHGIKDFVTFFVMPVFALFNAGVVVNVAGGINQITTGVFLGLVLGKPLGITLFSWLAVRVGLAELPRGANWGMVFGIGTLGGIGFTMALFIASLAFPGTAALVDSAKLGILAASLVTALLGATVLLLTTPKQSVP